MKIREVLNNRSLDIDDDQIGRESVWGSLKNDYDVAKQALEFYNKFKNITHNYQYHPLDILEIDEIYNLRQNLEYKLTVAIDNNLLQTVKILQYLISYFSTTTYPE